MDKAVIFSRLLRQYTALYSSVIVAYSRASLTYYKMFSELPHHAERPRVLEFAGEGSVNIAASLYGMEPKEAIDFLRGKGYKITFNWQELLGAAHKRAFTVAKVTTANVLQDMRSALLKAQAEGQTYKQFKKGVEPVLASQGWFGNKERTNPETGKIEKYVVRPSRLHTIYRTNMSAAYQKGRYEQQKASRATRPFLQYVSVIDDSTTDVCRRLNDKVFPANDPFWNKYTPPNHFNCRATTRTLTRSQIEREGLELEQGKYYEDGSDETHKQGFNYSPEDEPDIADDIRFDNDIRSGLRTAITSGKNPLK